MLGVCPRTLANLADAGRIKRLKLGKSVRYARVDLDAFVEELRAAGSVDTTGGGVGGDL
jgi:hypothetical protein